MVADTMDCMLACSTSRGPVATISFDRVDLVKPVFHGDLVRLEGQVISMNNSSMAIQVRFLPFVESASLSAAKIVFLS